MIDPKNITNFNRTEAELQEFLLFCIIAAGKNAHQQAQKLNNFLNQFWGRSALSPFEKLQSTWGTVDIRQRLEEVKMGQYTRIAEAFYNVCNWKNLGTRNVDDFMYIKGIGPKTARFFAMYSRPNQEIAVLDTHILKWMAAQGVKNVPKKTPSGNRYLKLEKRFLKMCKEKGKTPLELDAEIWKSYAHVN